MKNPTKKLTSSENLATTAISTNPQFPFSPAKSLLAVLATAHLVAGRADYLSENKVLAKAGSGGLGFSANPNLDPFGLKAGFSPIGRTPNKIDFASSDIFTDIDSKNGKSEKPNYILEGAEKIKIPPYDLFTFHEAINNNFDQETDKNSIFLFELSPLHKVAHNNSLELAKKLIDEGANLYAQDWKGLAPIHYALINGNIEMFRMFLDAGVDINLGAPNNARFIHVAALHGHLDICKLLIEKDVNIDSPDNENDTPLFYALSSINDESKNVGKMEVAKLLIDKGADLKAKNRLGRTPLHAATSKGNFEVCELLIEKGADVNAKEPQVGATPLHFVADEGNFKVCELLLENGAEINAKQIDGGTPLHMATIKGNFEVCKLLIEKGAKIDEPSNENATPLHIAAYYGHSDIAKLLIEKGAKKDILGKSGESACDIALKYGKAETAKIIDPEKYEAEHAQRTSSEEGVGNFAMGALGFAGIAGVGDALVYGQKLFSEYQERRQEVLKLELEKNEERIKQEVRELLDRTISPLNAKEDQSLPSFPPISYSDFDKRELSWKVNPKTNKLTLALPFKDHGFKDSIKNIFTKESARFLKANLI